MPLISEDKRRQAPLALGEEQELPWHTARTTLARWNSTYTTAAYILLERGDKRFICRVAGGAIQPRLWGDRHPREGMRPGDSIPGTGRQTWPLVAKWNRRYAPSRYEARRDPNTKEVLIWRTR